MLGRHGRSRRKRGHRERHYRSERESCKTSPHCPTRTGKAVDLGHYVVEEIADREKENAGSEDVFAVEGKLDRRDLVYADEVRTEEHRDERGHQEVEIFIPSGCG